MALYLALKIALLPVILITFSSAAQAELDPEISQQVSTANSITGILRSVYITLLVLNLCWAFKPGV